MIMLYMFIYKFLMFHKIYVQKNEYINIVVENNLKVKEKYVSFESKFENQKILVNYYFDDDITKSEIKDILLNIKYGAIYRVSVQSVRNIENTFYNKSSFKYDKYMLSKGILQEIVIKNVQYVGKEKSLIKNGIYKIKNYRKYLIDKITEKFPRNSIFINSLVLGQTIEDINLKNDIKTLGIIQLFTISGMHINFLIESIDKLLKKFKLQQKYIDLLIIIFLPLYGLLCNMGVSVERVIQMKYLEYYFKYEQEYTILEYFNMFGNIKGNKFQIWCIVFLVNVLLNPFNLYNVGFIFSYFVTFYLILNRDIFKIIRSSCKKNYYITTFILPLSINLNYKFNWLIFFSMYYYEYIVKYMIIICMLTVVFLNVDLFSSMLNDFLSVLTLLIYELNTLNLKFVLNVGNISITGLIVYYYFYYRQMEELYYLKNTSSKYMKIVILIIVIICMNINFLGKVDIIDVGQGDSILIKYPLNGKTILIDTGDVSAQEELINHLYSEGISKIDYLLITHNHMDHMGNVKSVIENFKIKNLVINNYIYTSNYDYLKGEEFKKINIIKVDGIVNTPIGYIWCADEYFENENNNSLVLYTKLGKYKWLFMGDIEKEMEEYLISKYDLDVDYIKLGHHGSKTSTTQEFLSETTPKEVFISSGRNNKYNHPSPSTIKKLKDNNIKYENTQTDGEITKYFI